MKLYTQAQQTVQDHYVSLVDYSQKRYVKETLMIVAILAMIVAGYCGYMWHQKRQNVQAFAGLMEISKAYEQALAKVREQKSSSTDVQKENPWEDTQLLLEAISTAHSGSSLSPFFTMYKAQLALDADHDFDTACALMDQGLRKLSKDSVYHDMFMMKRLKMLLDSPMQDIREKAVHDLEKMAADTENYYAQEALWTLGVYQAFHGNMDAATQAWKTLAQDDQSDKTLIASPWVRQAQEKLKTLNITE